MAAENKCMHANYTNKIKTKAIKRRRKRNQRQKGDWICAQICFWRICTLLLATYTESSNAFHSTTASFGNCFMRCFHSHIFLWLLLFCLFFYLSLAAVVHTRRLCILKWWNKKKKKKERNAQKICFSARRKQFHSFFALSRAPHSCGSFIRLRTLHAKNVCVVMKKVQSYTRVNTTRYIQSFLTLFNTERTFIYKIHTNQPVQCSVWNSVRVHFSCFHRVFWWDR